MIAPLVLVAYMIGVRFGPIGVAVSYSSIMIVLALPVIVWSIRGTAVRLRDIAEAARPPFQAGLIAGLVGLSMNIAAGSLFHPFTRLALGGCIVFGLYAWILLFRLNQKEFHIDLLRQVFRQK